MMQHRTKIRTALLAIVGASAMLLIAAGAQAGTWKPFRYHSAALKRDQTAQVYVPSSPPPQGGWPVVYLLHGLNGAPGDWNSLGNIVNTLDGLIAGKRIKPMLVVMPDGGNSWYVDSAAVGGPGDYATAIARDLPDAVEAAFPVGHDRDDRAIGGISMGGYGALRLALMAPDRYAAVAALSPALWQNIPLPATGAASAMHDRAPTAPYFQHTDNDTVTIGVDLPPEGHHFGTAFGSPFDPKRFNDANVFTLVQQAVESRRALPAIYISVGDDDSHRLWRGSIAFFETMQANNLLVEFRVTDGDHNWALWKTSIVDAIVFLDAHIDQPAVR